MLPWHDPLRVAEEIALLDQLSGGRMILGIGRGLARIEYEGFRVDMNTSRERFVEYARLVLDALETRYMEYDNQFGKQPRREIRPRPQHSFKGRTYAAAVSPESMPLMAKLGIGVLVIPQKPWEVVQDDLAKYTEVYVAEMGEAPPPPFSGGNVFCDQSADKAETMARRYIGANYESVMRHYEFAAAVEHPWGDVEVPAGSDHYLRPPTSRDHLRRPPQATAAVATPSARRRSSFPVSYRATRLVTRWASTRRISARAWKGPVFPRAR